MCPAKVRLPSPSARVLRVGFALGLFLAACRRPAASARPTADGGTLTAELAPAVPFELRDDSADVTLLWFDERGAPHSAARLSEVPQEHRDLVRVDPLRPEQRAAGWVYLSDARTRGSTGLYAVRAVQSETLALILGTRNGMAELAQQTPPPAPAAAVPAPAAPAAAPHGNAPAAPGAPAAQGAPRIVLYGASWCGACHQAAEYMRANHIPFVEHDIEQEPQAAQELMARAREQGVPTGRIPIISVDGRLMVGFSPPALAAALGNRGA